MIELVCAFVGSRRARQGLHYERARLRWLMFRIRRARRDADRCGEWGHVAALDRWLARAELLLAK